MAGNDKRRYKQLSHQDSASGVQQTSSTSSSTTIASTSVSSIGFQALSPPQTFVGSPVIPSGTSPMSPLLSVPSVLVRTVSGSSTQGLIGDTPQFCDTISNKTLFYLKSTLNASFQPDYDFDAI